MIIGGIDPGQHGAIVYKKVETESNIVCIPIPTIAKEIDGHLLFKLLKSIGLKDSKVIFFIEDVHAIFGVAAKATFNFGFNCGLIREAVIACSYDFHLVQPKVWQEVMFQEIEEIRKPDKINKKGKIIKGRRDTKAMAEQAYKKYFPGIDLYITETGKEAKKVHDGLVDAILIYEFGRRKIESA